MVDIYVYTYVWRMLEEGNRVEIISNHMVMTSRALWLSGACIGVFVCDCVNAHIFFYISDSDCGCFSAVDRGRCDL